MQYPDKITPEKIPPEKNPPEKILLNAVEREPVPTRVLNPNASEASYKPKQRRYRKTKLNFLFFIIIFFSGRFLPRTCQSYNDLAYSCPRG